MQRQSRRVLALILAAFLLLGSVAAAAGTTGLVDGENLAYGNEWAVIALARSGAQADYQAYYTALEVKLRQQDGELSTRRFTEYARVILALAALGQDARDVAGYDLTAPLGDFARTTSQGVNGAIWALLALDSRDYPLPAGGDATREAYLAYLLEQQLPDGGWSLSAAQGADPDLTAMALQALAKYQDQADVAAAIDRALSCMSGLQTASGGFASWGVETAESSAQMLIALCELGLAPDDARFVKNGVTIAENLLRYRLADGSFCHTAGGEANLVATQQGLCALAALARAEAGENSLYRMQDAEALDLQAGLTGLPGKDPAVQVVPVTVPDASFSDVTGAAAQAVCALAQRGILTGMGGGLFAPAQHMTRAEFAAAVVRALGLEPEATAAFSDVAADAWYAPYVGTASAFGIIQGFGDGTFRPGGIITRQEAAVMLARAAALCGLETALEDPADVLAAFPDYRSVAAWAQAALAFCYAQEMLDSSAPAIAPGEAVTRAEVAQMLYTLLTQANLLQ